MSRVGARRELEGTIPRATAVPRLAKPARHAGYAPGAHRSSGGCRRSGEAASLRRAGQASHRGVGGAGVPRLSRRLSPAATCGARGSPSVPLSHPVPTRDVSRVGLLARVKPALGLRGIVENERRYAWLIALAVLTGVLGAVGNVVFRDAILGATWLFQGRVAPLGRIGIPLALIGGGLVLLALDRLFPGEVLGYGFPRFLEMLHLHGA